MKAVVLAAGEGTRLRPLTIAVPKPMVPVCNTPLLARTPHLLQTQGIRDVAINLFHRPEVIQAAFGDGSQFGLRLHYFTETSLKGTAGSIRQMAAFLDEPFLVLYGDNLYQADFSPLVAFHREKRALATLATFTTPTPSACGLVVTNASNSVTRFQEKPPPVEVFTDQASAGLYVLQPEVLDYIPAETPLDFGHDVFPALLADRPGSLFARPLNGYLQDTGTIAAYRQANWDVLEGRTGAAGEAGISPAAHISPDTSLTGRNIIGKDVVVEKGAALRNCIVWEDCIIEAGAHLTGAILGQGVHIGSGAIIGEGVVIGASVRVPAGARITSGRETVLPI